MRKSISAWLKPAGSRIVAHPELKRKPFAVLVPLPTRCWMWPAGLQKKGTGSGWGI